jgi:uncharacterized protein (TIGR02594 family)
MSEPSWLKIARSCEGLKEIPGPRHNQKIIRWLGKLRAWWNDDETPWCGVFVAHCMQKCSLPFPKLYMRAKAWSDYGSLLRRDRLAPGAILVFDRAGSGHVGFAVAQDATHYHVLGGNQSNAVNIMRIGKNRLVASRWPKGEPVIGSLPYIHNSKIPVSKSEA